MSYNEVGFVLVAIVSLAAARAWVRQGMDPWMPARLLLIGVLARIVGSLVRYQFLFEYYGGVGDANRYYAAGLLRARELWNEPLSLFSAHYWSLRQSAWGTGFVEQIGGIVLAVIGETMRGGFLVFAMLGFVGAYLMVRGYALGHPHHRAIAAATWVWLWPSLWYWPSSIGKEALVLLAFGLVTYGYVAKASGKGWLSLLAGIGLAYLIRPHVATVLVMAVILAELLATLRNRLTPMRLLEIVVIMVTAMYVVQGAQQRLGLNDIDLEGVAEVTAWYSAQTEKGGSSIGEAPSGVLAPFEATVNVWLRPFIWEAHNFTAALAALEVLVFLMLIWRQRAYVYHSLWRWHRDPLMRFVVPLLIGYTLMIGLTFANLGIIARQRSPMLPFVFLFFAGSEEPLFARRRQEAQEIDESAVAPSSGGLDEGSARPVLS